MPRPRRAGPAGEDDGVDPGYVAVGRILGAWGLHGDLKVAPLAPPELLAPGCAVRLSGIERTIERSQPSGRFLRIRLSGIEGRESAALHRLEYLQVREGDLEDPGEDTYYRFQLIGLAVRATDGRDLGRITDVMSTGGSDVFVANGPLGEVLIPAVDEVVVDVDVAGGVMTVEVVPGLLP